MNTDVLDALSFATALPFAISPIRPIDGSPVWEAITVDDLAVTVLPFAVPPQVVVTDEEYGARGHRADWSTVESIAATIVAALLITRAMSAGDAV